MKKIDIEKMAIQYCKKKVKVKKFSDQWQPLSINEMVEFAESVVNKISSNPLVIKSVCRHKWLFVGKKTWWCTKCKAEKKGELQAVL